jgi:hypothetical protein
MLTMKTTTKMTTKMTTDYDKGCPSSHRRQQRPLLLAVIDKDARYHILTSNAAELIGRWQCVNLAPALS